jgi:RimJ/RimL family protein N-acetyltransferase
VPADAEAIAAYRSDPDVHRYQGWDRTDVDGVRQQIEEMAAREPGQPGGWVQLTVEEREGGRLVGDVGLSPADGEPGVVKIGYTIEPESQGRGYATEGGASADRLRVRRAARGRRRAYASAENLASIRVAEKAGMP